MATIRKRGKAYCLYWNDQEGEHLISLGKIPKKEANIRLLNKEYELAHHQDHTGGPLFHIFTTEYLNWHALEFPDSHWRIYQIVHQYLIPKFGLSAIGYIERKSVEEYKQKRLIKPYRISDDGSGIIQEFFAAPETVAKELRTLQAIMNKAVEWNFIGRNQLKGIKPPKDHRDAPPPFYDLDEIKLIYQNALDPVKEATWRLLINTGMRSGEIRGLRKEYITDKGIKVLSTTESRTKSGKWRLIPHNDATRGSLEILRQVDGHYVIPQVHPKSLSRAFDNCRKRAKIGGSLHWCRHTYASHLVMAGVSLRTVQILLGHSSIRTTEKYAHLSPEWLEHAVPISL